MRCRFCELDGGCPDCRALSDKECAVVEAAKALVAHWNRQLGEMRGASVESQDLRAAVRALSPEAKRPFDVGPGEKFRFAGQLGRLMPSQAVHEMLYFEGSPAWASNGIVMRFSEHDRIIPLPESE